MRYGPGEYENDPGAFLKNLISLIKPCKLPDMITSDLNYSKDRANSRSKMLNSSGQLDSFKES